MHHGIRVIDHVVDFLGRQGVERVFGVGGANIEDLYDALQGTGVHGVVAKHEFSAATMADGYHRASQKVAALVATSGAGAMNLVPGIAELKASCVPAIVLIGQPPAALDGLGSFQETSGLRGSIHATRLFGEISVYCAKVDDPADILTMLPAAYAAATDGPVRGPAVLLLPKDVQQATLPARPVAEPAAPATVPLAADEVHDRAVQVLCSARERQGVAVIAGEGVARADARDDLAELAGVLDAPVATVPDAKDVFDASSPLGLGTIGAIARPGARERLEQASAIMLVGTRLPQIAGAPLRDHLKGVPVVCLDSRRPFLTDHQDLVCLTGPLKKEMGRLTARLTTSSPSASSTVPRVPAQAADTIASGETGADTGPLNLRTAALTLSAALPDGANVITDAGNGGAAAIRHVDVPRGGRFITAMGMGGMGHSFGAGIGAAFGTGARTYVLAGDGSFLMHGLEMHTAVEEDLPVTFVIFNNNAHAMCHTREQLFYSGEYTYNVFRPTRIGDGIAAMFPGLDVETARTPAALRAAVLRTRSTPLPSFICIDVDHTEMPPFGPFLQHQKAGKGRPADVPDDQFSTASGR